MKKFFTIVFFGAAFTANAQPLNIRNIIVSRVGDGTTSLTTSTSAYTTSQLSLLEFNITGLAQTPIKTTTVASTIAGSRLTITGSGVLAEGLLSLSVDGKYASLVGYDLPVGEPTTNSCISGIAVKNNGILSIPVSSGGTGYTTVPTVTISGGGGSGAVANATVSGGVVISINITNNGSGYTSQPTITFGTPGTGAISGTCTFTSTGSGFTSAPTVTISAPNLAGGVQATANAQFSAGALSNIYMTNNGAGYTSTPTVTLSGGGGTGAVAGYVNLSYPYWQGSAVRKVIGRFDYNTNIDYSTGFLTTNAVNTPTSPKMATSTDGSSFWVSYNNLSYIPFGSSTATQINSASAAGVHIYKDVMLNTNSYNPIVYFPGTLPYTVTAPTNIITQNSYFYSSLAMLDADQNVSTGWNGTGCEVMYLADKAYGIAKYYWNGTAWTPLNIPTGTTGNNPAPTIGVSGGGGQIIATLNSLGIPVIYGVSSATVNGNTSQVFSLEDNSGYNQPMVSGTNTTLTYLAQAGTNYAFRGITFAPTQYSLPIYLASFTGSLVNGKSALQWTTSSAINAKEFIIERSENGVDFASIGSVATKNTTEKTNYTFEDATIKTVNYYRLKLVDQDGSFKYSSVIVIKTGNTSKLALSVFPNPVSSNLTINHAKADDAAIIQVVTINGKVVSQYQVAKNATQTSIDVSRLLAGQYIVNYINNNQRSTVAFVK